MSEELKLLDCPFCGGEAEYEGLYCYCTRCECRMADDPNEFEAIAAWNRRAPMTAPTPAGEEMEKLLERAREIAADDVSAMTASWVDTQAFARALLSSPRVEEVRRMREALEKIARQELSVDMSVDDQLGGDFEGAYNYMIEDARAALSPTDGAPANPPKVRTP